MAPVLDFLAGGGDGGGGGAEVGVGIARVGVLAVKVAFSLK